MFDQIGKFIGENPEATAIALDKIGQNLAPNNAFAGVGTALGQSTLANAAAQKQMEERKAMIGMLTKALGGGEEDPAKTPTAAPRTKGNFSLLEGMDVGKLTSPDQPGPTSMTFKAGPDGTVTSTQQGTVSPGKAKQPIGVNLSDVAPFF